MTGEAEIRGFYAEPTEFTRLGTRVSSFGLLPADVSGLVRTVQGLIVYDVVASDFYGIDVPPERAMEIHLRRVEQFIDRLLEIDDGPLTIARPPENRLVGRCHHFALLLTALFRGSGVPARARCGFADYFNVGFYEDHWVCEYWDGEQGRWVLADAQLDEVWREKCNIDFDILDVPRTRFLCAGEAWSRCRSGQADPAKFGIDHAGLRGLWFVAGDLIRDVAALNKDEMLPWDVWGAQPTPDDSLDSGFELFDRLAELTCEPDARLSDLREAYLTDDCLRVPATVLNVLVEQRQAAR